MLAGTSLSGQNTEQMNPKINITIPVYNEEKVLADTIGKLTAYVDLHLAGRCEIVIANNGSTDRTEEVGRQLQQDCSNVRLLDINAKGRGGALKQAWSKSKAEILSYMDCDISTDLNCFPDLIEPLIKGTHDISIGSRLLPESITTRGVKRSVVSHGYNFLIRTMFRPSFSDAQCGFKAITKQAFTSLCPLIHDDGWFMDTELLLIADAAEYRIFDLPVRWTDDPDSKVKIFQTAIDDIKGLLRVRRNIRAGKYAVSKRSPEARPCSQFRTSTP